MHFYANILQPRVFRSVRTEGGNGKYREVSDKDMVLVFMSLLNLWFFKDLNCFGALRRFKEESSNLSPNFFSF